MTPKEFWQAVYVAAIHTGNGPMGAALKADEAVKASNDRHGGN